LVNEKARATKTVPEVAHKQCKSQVFVTHCGKQHQFLYIKGVFSGKERLKRSKLHLCCELPAGPPALK